MKTTRRLAGLLAIVALVAACSSSGAAGSTPAGTDSGASTGPILPSADTGATKGPDTPVGSDLPHVEPGPGSATFVTPKPGQQEIHPVAMDALSAAVDGRHVVLTATWTSGVEPCNALDSIVVARGDGAFTITLREGHGPRDIACIEIAVLKGTKIDLGDLEPGTYLISDGGGSTVSTQVVVS
jgi:hypothetical protein